MASIKQSFKQSYFTSYNMRLLIALQERMVNEIKIAILIQDRKPLRSNQTTLGGWKIGFILPTGFCCK